MKAIELEINSKLVTLLKQHFPDRGVLSSYLSNLLHMDKVNVYRRLHNTIPFTLAETILISKHSSIPLNSLFELKTDMYRSQSFQMFWQDFKNMNEKDLKMGNDYITAIEIAAQDENSEFGIAMNNMPLHILAQYPNIYRFFMLKWIHEFSDHGELVKYSDIVIPDFLIDQLQRYTMAVRKVKKTLFISDETILPKMIRDIHYFRDIKIITNNEIENIKQDIRDLIHNIEQLAISGCYPNGNKLEMYTTGLTFETTYTYLLSTRVKLSMVDVYTLGSMSSEYEESCSYMKKWIQGLKRTSIRVTDSEINRIKYLDNQYRELEKI